MRIFIAGASGVIGRRLVDLLVGQGHDVAAMTRSVEKTDALRRVGAQPVLCDVYDLQRLTRVIEDFRPEVIFDQLTDLPDDPADLERHQERNDRMRKDGSGNLLVAAAASGSPRLISQSIAWELPQEQRRQVLVDHERAVLDRNGVVIRYGQLYGPATFYPDEPPAPPRIHVDDAARLSLRALDAGGGTTLVIEEEQQSDTGNIAPTVRELSA